MPKRSSSAAISASAETTPQDLFDSTAAVVHRAMQLEMQGKFTEAQELMAPHFDMLFQEFRKYMKDPDEHAGIIRYLGEMLTRYTSGTLPGSPVPTHETNVSHEYAGTIIKVPQTVNNTDELPKLPWSERIMPQPKVYPQPFQVDAAPTPEKLSAPQSWREQAKAKYYKLYPGFTVSDEGHATRDNGEILRDLDGKPLRGNGGDVAVMYHTVNALKGRNFSDNKKDNSGFTLPTGLKVPNNSEALGKIVAFPEINGVIFNGSERYISSAVIDPLRNAAKEAQKRGYQLIVTSAYRSVDHESVI